MAASEGIHGGMYDVTLKPRLLRSLLMEYVPDENRAFRNPSDLAHIVSTLRTHQLLSERATHSTGQKVIDNWKSAVDAWFNRVFALASSNMPDKSWAGICLLGLSFQDCSSQRFLASYSVWFNKIFSFIQFPSDSHFVRVASCASLSDLFTRLGEFTIARKDGTSHATKVVQALVKLLDKDASDVVWEEALRLLCIIIKSFPSSIGRHYDNIEAAIVSKIMSENCSSSLLETLGHSLALLPKSKGDNESWSTMITKILLFLNSQLNEVFQGFEEGSRRDEAMKLLLPPGKEALPPLGGIKGVSIQDPNRSEEVLVSRASVMLVCCCNMLASPYPAQVSVPVRPLIAIARRVLLVDGSLSNSYAFMSGLRHEFICSELPLLHQHILDLLVAIVKGLRSQILPHVSDITRLLTAYFGACELPELRIKLYSVVKVLLTSMGVGIAMCLTQDILKNAFMDLDSPGRESSSCAQGSPQDEVALPSKKKRKHSSKSGFVEEKSDQSDLEASRSHVSTPIAVKIAVLEVLEALLTVGGALRSNNWRPRVDHLLMNVASSACRGGWASEKNTATCSSDPPILAEFQLASLRALLASLLSPGRVRPPHLARGLDLFRRGSQNFGTKIAEHCNHALLALEVLIHPRALPLIDFQNNDHHYSTETSLPDNINSNRLRHNSTFRGGMAGKRPNELDSSVDDLYESWFGNGEIEAVVTVNGETVTHPEDPLGNSNNTLSEKVTADLLLPDAHDLEATDIIPVNNDKMIVDPHTPEHKKPEQHNHQGDNFMNPKDVDTAPREDLPKQHNRQGDNFMIPKDVDTTPREDLTEDERQAVVPIEVDLPIKDVAMTGEDGRDSILDTMAVSISHTEQNIRFTDGKDEEPLPDIVDGDPDSE